MSFSFFLILKMKSARILRNMGEKKSLGKPLLQQTALKKGAWLRVTSYTECGQTWNKLWQMS